MKTKKELCPKIYKTKEGRYQIYLWYKNKRYRFAIGSAIKENLMPNILEEPDRGNMAFLLNCCVNGEWIKDRQESQVSIEQRTDFDEVWIRVKVKGYWKPQPEHIVSFEFSLGLGINVNPIQSFSEGDNFYFRFKASQSGYLYLFMVD